MKRRYVFRQEFDADCREAGGYPVDHPCRWYRGCRELYSAVIDAFGLTYTAHCCRCRGEPREPEWVDRLYSDCLDECGELYEDDPDSEEMCATWCVRKFHECMEKHRTREQVTRCMGGSGG